MAAAAAANVAAAAAFVMDATATVATHNRAKRYFFFPPHLQHKSFRLEKKFSGVFYDVLYSVTSYLLLFTSETSQQQRTPYIASEASLITWSA